MTRAAGKVDDYMKKLAQELRGGSHENSSWIKPYKTYKVDDITLDGIWGTSTVTITYDATAVSTSTEEVRWKKVSGDWYIASDCDEEEEDEGK
jgi:hypothetical protein